MKEYQLYKRFLDSLAPREWKEERRVAHHQRKEIGKKKKKKSGEEEKSAEEEGEVNPGAGMGAGEETGSKDEMNLEGANVTANNATFDTNSMIPWQTQSLSENGGYNNNANSARNNETSAGNNATANATGAEPTSLFGGHRIGASEASENVNAVIEVDEGGISSDSDIGDEEEEEQLHLYFTDPNQLLDMLGDLEEQNLSLIQNRSTNENLVF